jgi:hypothetical protein
MRFFLFLNMYLRGLQRRDPVVIIATVCILGLILYVVLAEIKRNRTLRQSKFQAVTCLNEAGICHLISQESKMPDGVIAQLLAFDTAEEIYDYVYKKFGEAAFEKLVIHRKERENATFTHDDTQTEAENIARLNDLLFGEPKTPENP